MERITAEGLQVGPELHATLVEQVLPGSGIEADAFFHGLVAVIAEFGPRNVELLEIRAADVAGIEAAGLTAKI